MSSTYYASLRNISNTHLYSKPEMLLHHALYLYPLNTTGLSIPAPLKSGSNAICPRTSTLNLSPSSPLLIINRYGHAFLSQVTLSER